MQSTVNKGKYFTPLSIGVAAVWFSSHCGAGFASGTQEVAYFVRHGWMAPFWPLLAMTLVGMVMYVTLEVGRLHAVYTYAEIVQKLMNRSTKYWERSMTSFKQSLCCWRRQRAWRRRSPL